MINREKMLDIPSRVRIIGVPISAVNMNECIEFLMKNWNYLRGNYICVSNVHTTVMAHDNPQYFKVQAESLLSLPDGKPLSVIGKKSYPIMDRVTGPDLMRRIFQESKNQDFRHYFYGTTRENLDNLIEKIKVDYPWINVVGSEASIFRPMTELEERKLVDRINDTNPDFVWVALGAPRQEEFCYRNEGKINGLMIGVGGAFNVVSGVIDEAPRWLQDIGLEWFYRLLKEPRRLYKRYLVTNSRFIKLLIREKIDE